MRIAYIAHISGGSKSGVYHKVLAQVDQWRQQGHEVKTFITTRDDPAIWRSRLGDSLVLQYGGPASRMLALSSLVRAVRRFAPSVTYRRWDLYYPQMLFLPGDAPVVMEVNTDDVHELKLGSRKRAIYNTSTRRLTLRQARAMVFVTGELSRAPAFEGYRGLRRVISNGIDLAAYPSLPATGNDAPRLVFVGAPGQPWHGIDKLVGLARIRPEWRFDIVGSTSDGDGSPNTTWHGELDRGDVLSILARADVGIGTLALHRKSMDEACALKVREYLAVGLPVVYGHHDPDVDGLDKYALRIPNNESNVGDELAQITEFVMASRGARVPRDAIRHIDVSAKEQQRLALFEHVSG